MTFLSGPGPRWFTIAAHRPFLTDLAKGLTEALSPEALAEAAILLPNRRAARALAEALLAASDRPALLPPQMRPLGDLEAGEAPFEPGHLSLDLAPAISPARRRFELAGLVARHAHLLEREATAVSALDLADALGAFLDACQIEEVGVGVALPPPTPPSSPGPVPATHFSPAGQSVHDPRPMDGRDLRPAMTVAEENGGGTALLESLVEGDFARHWALTAEFLNIALKAWPERLNELGLMDLAARRVALIRALTERWRQRPPAGILIAAGSTGSTRATADLLAAIAAAPRGAVVLPGLDQSLSDKAWAEVGDQHPQGALRRALDQARVPRGAVRPWPGSAETMDTGRWRRRLISEALTPAERTADWLDVIKTLRAEARGGPDPIAAGLAGLTLVSAHGEDEAAAVAALILRHTLETPGRTAALVTPDTALARRVQAQLGRWGVRADSSIGLPLAATGPGVLAALVARAVAEPFDPVTLLAIAKHPLTRLGLSEERLAEGRRTFERRGLRGPSPGGFEGLKARLSGPGLWLAERLERALDLAAAPFSPRDTGGGPAEWPGGGPRPHSAATAPSTPSGSPSPASQGRIAAASQAAEALAHCLEILSHGEREGPMAKPWEGEGVRRPPHNPSPWAGAAGEALAAVVTGLLHETAALPPLTPGGFRDLLTGLLERDTVRDAVPSHPRLKIMGVLEARLTAADVTILAGLEEGVWPQAAPLDPFLSRPMRARLGLPSPERRIGLSAHDFAQGACAPEVTLLVTERREGAPTVQSRWLWRLRTLVKGAGLEIPGRPDILAIAREIDAPLDNPPPSLRTAVRPRPTPPLAARPRELPVTDIEKWVRDPYAIYARRILKLRPLDPPGAPIEARARGIAIHKAFERLALIPLADIDEAGVAALIIEALTEEGLAQASMAREHALAASLARWTVDFERGRRDGAVLHVEQSGRMSIPAAGGDFVLTARADRLEARAEGVDILDFKTGRLPTREQVKSGLAPQLTLTGAIAMAGGFECLGPMSPRQLLYVRLRGGKRPGDEVVLAPGPALAEAALAGLKRRIDGFDDPATDYPAKAAPQFMDDPGDYDALARTWEWLVIGEAEEPE